MYVNVNSVFDKEIEKNDRYSTNQSSFYHPSKQKKAENTGLLLPAFMDPVNNSTPENIPIKMLLDEENEVFAVEEVSASTKFDESWPNTIESFHKSPEKGNTINFISKPSKEHSIEDYIEQNGTLSSFIQRFRQQPPLPREERQQKTTTDPDFWWLQSETEPNTTHLQSELLTVVSSENIQSNGFNEKASTLLSDDDTTTLDVQTTATRLLELSESTLSNTTILSRTPQNILNNPVHEPTQNPWKEKKTHKAFQITNKLQTKVQPSTNPLKPENDILYQWRLNRKMEMAAKEVQKQKSPSWPSNRNTTYHLEKKNEQPSTEEQEFADTLSSKNNTNFNNIKYDRAIQKDAEKEKSVDIQMFQTKIPPPQLLQNQNQLQQLEQQQQQPQIQQHQDAQTLQSNISQHKDIPQRCQQHQKQLFSRSCCQNIYSCNNQHYSSCHCNQRQCFHNCPSVLCNCPVPPHVHLVCSHNNFQDSLKHENDKNQNQINENGNQQQYFKENKCRSSYENNLTSGKCIKSVFNNDHQDLKTRKTEQNQSKSRKKHVLEDSNKNPLSNAMPIVNQVISEHLFHNNSECGLDETVLSTSRLPMNDTQQQEYEFSSSSEEEYQDDEILIELRNRRRAIKERLKKFQKYAESI